MVYSEAKLNSVGDEVSLCFIVFTDKCIGQCFLTWTLVFLLAHFY
jgi:hypothetical protein